MDISLRVKSFFMTSDHSTERGLSLSSFTCTFKI